MDGILFEWDAAKAAKNHAKHGVTFEEATSVFGDPLSMTVADLVHSNTVEDRFVTIGMSRKSRVLVVSHFDRGQRIRIISAREPTLRERRTYEEGPS